MPLVTWPGEPQRRFETVGEADAELQRRMLPASVDLGRGRTVDVTQADLEAPLFSALDVPLYRGPA